MVPDVRGTAVAFSTGSVLASTIAVVAPAAGERTAGFASAVGVKGATIRVAVGICVTQNRREGDEWGNSQGKRRVLGWGIPALITIGEQRISTMLVRSVTDNTVCFLASWNEPQTDMTMVRTMVRTILVRPNFSNRTLPMLCSAPCLRHSRRRSGIPPLPHSITIIACITQQTRNENSRDDHTDLNGFVHIIRYRKISNPKLFPLNKENLLFGRFGEESVVLPLTRHAIVSRTEL